MELKVGVSRYTRYTRYTWLILNGIERPNNRLHQSY